MKRTRIQLALGILALAAAGTVCADNAGITQSGSSNTATIDQTQGAGWADGWITQIGGASTKATVTQAGVAAGTYGYGEIVQSNVFNGQASVVQGGVGGPSTYGMVTQANGSFLNAGLSQFNTVNGYALVQQTGGSNNASASQANTQGSSLYVSQGLGGVAASYFNGQGAMFTVDPNVPASEATNSSAVATQTGSGNTGYILQYGNSLTSQLHQSGSGNLGGTLQSGSFNSASVDQFGTNGVATISQLGTGFFGSIWQSGNGNTATIRQHQ